MRAIDTFVNVNMGEQEPPKWLTRVAEDYFKRAEEIFRSLSIDELLESMDRAGVDKAVLTTTAERPSPHVLSFPEARPDRFALSVQVDPQRGMRALRALESIAGEQPVVLARVVPFMVGLPPDDRCYYPVYAKCIELGLPIAVNTGLPGPARARQDAGPDVPGRGLLLLPRPDGDHGTRRRPLVERRDPADDQVSEPLPADLGLRAALLPA
jgi:predicted TIM-barrel fold metal-dependent hydrolase